MPDDPVKSVSTSTASIGDTITYTIQQDISEASGYYDTFYYTSLSFEDTLQDELEFVSLSVLNENGEDVTATAGIISTLRTNHLLYI